MMSNRRKEIRRPRPAGASPGVGRQPLITLRRLGALAAAAALAAAVCCSAQPETPAAGTCTLSCASPKVGAREWLVTPQIPNGDETITLHCNANFKGNPIAPFNGPVQVKYLIYEPLSPAFPSSGGGSAGGTTAGGTTGLSLAPFTGSTGSTDRRPVGGIGFEPVLYGTLSVENTNPEFKPDGPAGGSVSSFKFAGVVTPSNEWCSDSCGVMTYEFWPDCLAGASNTIQAGIAAGNAQVQKDYHISLTNP